jgi:hypothetical protein
MQRKVPQNIDIQDKIIWKLGPKQLIIAMIFAGIAAFFATILEMSNPFNWVYIVIVIALGAIFVLMKPLDLEFEQFLLVAIRYILKAKKRIWYKVPDNVKFVDDSKANQSEQDWSRLKKVSGDIGEITRILDTGGLSASRQFTRGVLNKSDDFEFRGIVTVESDNSYSDFSMDLDPEYSLGAVFSSAEVLGKQKNIVDGAFIPDSAANSGKSSDNTSQQDSEEGEDDPMDDPMSGFFKNPYQEDKKTDSENEERAGINSDDPDSRLADNKISSDQTGNSVDTDKDKAKDSISLNPLEGILDTDRKTKERSEQMASVPQENISQKNNGENKEMSTEEVEYKRIHGDKTEEDIYNGFEIDLTELTKELEQVSSDDKNSTTKSGVKKDAREDSGNLEIQSNNTAKQHSTYAQNGQDDTQPPKNTPVKKTKGNPDSKDNEEDCLNNLTIDVKL